MKIALTSVCPKKLKKDKVYLCGKASLVDEIRWCLRVFDGERLVNYDEMPCNANDFLYSLDGYTDDYLIFELADTGMPDNGIGGIGELYNQLISTELPLNEGKDLAKQHAVKVTFEDGRTITTSIFGTKKEIAQYYFGNSFNFGDTEEHPADKLLKGIEVEFLGEE